MVAKIFSAAHISNIPVRLDSIARNATLVIGRYPNGKFHAGNVEFQSAMARLVCTEFVANAIIPANQLALT